MNNRGFSVAELTVVTAVIGLVAAFTIPAMNNALERNRVFTSSELVAAQVREARLAAITRSSTYRVRFDCFGGRAMRMLIVTGDPAVDDDGGRCGMNVPNDGSAVYLPPNIVFGGASMLEIDARGTVTSPDGPMPQPVGVTDGSFTRTVIVWGSGRVRTPTS